MIDLIKLEKQKQHLNDVIINGNNKDKFKVLDLEAGTGKTLQAEISIANANRKSILVRERIKDCIESQDRINNIAGMDIAIAINSETVNAKQWETLQKQIKHYAVVIITHEKYKSLAIRSKDRQTFIQGREILVIDEFLNITNGNILSISKKWIDEFETLLQHRSLRNLFAECVDEIEDYLITIKKPQSFFNAKINVDKKINKLKQLAKENLDVKELQEQGHSKNEIVETIDNLKQFYNQTCVVEGKIIYCTNRKYRYWLLDNNVMLDASATLNKAYNLSPLFEISRQGAVFRHEKWSFLISKTNSTKSAKGRALDFYEVVNRVAGKLDNPLVVGNKDDSSHFQSDNINWFGNLTGSNQYRDLKDCIIAHNPNVPFRTYVLEYLYYSNIKLDNRTTWTGIKSGKGDEMVYRFKDKRFEDYRQGRNANEIYQAIKRVNRSMEYESKIFIFNNDMEVVNKVLKMFKGVKESAITEHDNVVEFEKSKQKEHLQEHNQNQKDNSYSTKFIDLMQEIKQGNHKELIDGRKIKKLVICEKVGLDINKFRRRIGNNADVLDYCNKNNILIKGQNVMVG
ncbi:hypothetical protein Amet_2840 [Alkaliphilus metalliredigens QYMF]|uniref:Uncharacterized protein n=1 Tax=Alkaliphilus metalliredigens (strain QYMF) TaxID=293826 RepID=A6TS22_ALKMQ|nr:hypothetical protein [Alkaliphilus metalliredigens]ABR48990.1 hypothetical protein Amet_2840 [Alkaliphilus metalliredigens QYMF]